MDISPRLEPPPSIFLVPMVQGILLLLLFCALVFRVDELTLFCLVLLVLGAGCSLWSRASLKAVHCSLLVDR